jgi:predicted transposase YdaD
MQIVTSWMEQGIEQGRQEGRQEGELLLVLRFRSPTDMKLNRRFGSLEPEREAQIRALPITQLEALAEAVLDFAEPRDLAAWLETNS